MTDKKYFWLHLTMIFVTFLFCACNREVKRARKYAELFPIKERVEIIERIEIDTFIIPDTHIEYLDTTICPPGAASTMVIKTVTKKLPGKVMVREKVCTDTVIVQESTAKLVILNHQLDSLRKVNLKLDKTVSKKKGANRALMIAFVAILGLLGVFLWKKRK